MELNNEIKIAGRVESYEETWRGDKGAFYTLRIMVNEYKGKEYFAIVKASEELINVEGFGIGAEIQASGGLGARQGKDGRWWGDATIRTLSVVKASTQKPEVVQPTLEDDEIPF